MYIGGAERSNAYKSLILNEPPSSTESSSSVLRVSGLPLTADNQAVAELFPGTMLSIAEISFSGYDS